MSQKKLIFQRLPQDGFGWFSPLCRRIFFIIGMEACERFSYYGMRAILTIYLIYLLKVKFCKTGQNTSLVRTLALSKKPPPGTNIHIVYSGLPINFKIPFLKPHYPDNEEKASSVATMIFHFFAFGSYASGLLGAALADSKAGPRHHRSVLRSVLCWSSHYSTLRICDITEQFQANTAPSYTLGSCMPLGRPFLLLGRSALGRRHTWSQ